MNARLLSLLLTFILVFACAAAAHADDKPYHVAIIAATAPGKEARGLMDFVKAYLERDSRYIVTEKRDDATTHTLAITLLRDKKTTKLTLAGSALKGKDGAFEAELPPKALMAAVESELGRGLRDLFDYKPPRRKVLVTIKAKAAEGDADGGMMEGALSKALQIEYDTVSADPYKYPVKDENIPALLKGDKKLLALFAKDNPVDLVIVGTIDIPPVKNVGGASTNSYLGVAKVRVYGYDVKRQVPVTQAVMELRGTGVYSELIFSLVNAASEKVVAEVSKDLGLPAPKAPEPKADPKSTPAQEDEEENGGE